LTDGRRKAMRTAGIILVAVALGLIGYASYHLISTEIDVRDSLQEAELQIEAGRMADDMNAYTGAPEDTPGQPANTAAAPESQVPDETPEPGGQSPESAPTAAEDTATDDPAATAAAATAKPKSKPPAYGILIFDSLGGRKVPVFNGTSAEDLSNGAAHHPRTSKPGAVGNCVIFGHRNTVFRGFGKLQVGDTIRLEVPGITYTYKISSMAVVDPDDKRIYQAYGQAVMTLVTCYPFNYIGAAPQRYIVVAILQ
jgi:sortase A